MQKEVFDKLYKINQNYKVVKISDIGCYELKSEDIRRVAGKEIMSGIIEVLFKRIDDEFSLSRNAIYYDFDCFHSYIDSFAILLAKTAEIYNEDRTMMYVLSALLDYFENYQLTYWYALLECIVDNTDIQCDLYEYFIKIEHGIEETIKSHLRVYVGEVIDSKKLISNIQKQCKLIKTTMDLVENRVQMSFRLFREYDNRIKCINEIVYSLYALERDGIKVDNLFMPLYGASLLAVYATPVMDFFDIKKNTEVLYARIGFHDLLPLDLSIDFIESNESKIAPCKYMEKLKKAFRNKTTLVIDDNVGYGLTLNCCKRMIEVYGGTCYTRTPETSWDKFLGSGINVVTDYPGISNYLRYTQQSEFIESLHEMDRYTRELEYKKCDRHIEPCNMDNYQISEMQKERIKIEYEIRKQFDQVDFSLGIGDISCLNWVNIDIINSKCTVNEKLSITDMIEKIFEKHMEICIVDLDKSIYGQSMNELNKYLKQYDGKLWIAGGIASLGEAETLIQNGAKGVVIGSALYRDGNLDDTMVEEFINRFDMGRVYFSLDYMGDNIVTKGFQEATTIKLHDVLQKFDKKNANVNVILVDVNASKNQIEVDFEKILNIIRGYEHINFCYGGNLANWEQVRKLNNLGVGAILGKNYLKGDFV